MPTKRTRVLDSAADVPARRAQYRAQQKKGAIHLEDPDDAEARGGAVIVIVTTGGGVQLRTALGRNRVCNTIKQLAGALA